MSELKSWSVIIIAGAIVGIGCVSMLRPSKADVLKQQQVSQCIKENRAQYEAIGTIYGDKQMGRIAGELACKKETK